MYFRGRKMKDTLYLFMCGLLISTSGSFWHPTEVKGVYNISGVIVIGFTIVGFVGCIWALVEIFKKYKK